ncbi:MAG: YeeE/YedE thiosulfate transporter family protein [Geoalkalibacter sp.]|uniref:YeeE/YedE thiosulfate transporter family protein n=1 Tax=Geoalkalibacter sp. TaxID=3041440 RepID=UPI003D0D267D
MIFRAGLSLSAFVVLLLTTASLALAQGEVKPQTLNAEHGMLGFLYLKSWSPYAAGIGIGILSWFAFLLSDHPLGVSTAYARSSGMIETAIRGDKARSRPYYQRFTPQIDWEWMLVIGIIFGAAISATLSGDFSFRFMPDVWVAEFGDGWPLRWFTAFIGGIIMGIGARWANGCTSGHALSGTMQLVASSWVAAIGIFVGGIITAYLIF